MQMPTTDTSTRQTGANGATEAVDLHWKLMDTIRRVGGQIEKQLQPFCSRHSITPLQLTILATLHFKGPQTVSSLAHKTSMAGANNSALCKKLEKDGLVTRQRDPEDERQVLVSLTQKGRVIIEAFSVDCKSSSKKLEKVVTRQEMATIFAGLDTLVKVMERT